MSKELIKSITEYFCCVEKCNKNWIAMCDRLKSTINVLRNQMEQLRAVSSYEADNLEIFKIEGVRCALISKINIAISETINVFKEELLKLLNDSQQLGNKLRNLEKAKSKIPANHLIDEDIVKGIATRPNLNTLLKYSIEAHDYYRNLYTNCHDCLNALSCKNKDLIENLTKLFSYDTLEQQEIKKLPHTLEIMISYITLDFSSKIREGTGT